MRAAKNMGRLISSRIGYSTTTPIPSVFDRTEMQSGNEVKSRERGFVFCSFPSSLSGLSLINPIHVKGGAKKIISEFWQCLPERHKTETMSSSKRILNPEDEDQDNYFAKPYLSLRIKFLPHLHRSPVYGDF